MKKYVSKDDVEKGLVDPHKPLQQQKEYMSKIQQEDKKKQYKKEKKQNYKKRQRQNRPQYDWNRKNVTLDTAVPAAPKKAISKPDKDKYHDQLNAYRKRLDELYQQKNKLLNQMKFALKNNSDHKRTGDATRSKFSAILKDKNNEKKIFQDAIQALQLKRDGVDGQIRKIKEKIQSLKKPQNFADCSKQQLQRRLEKTQMRLTTEELNKNQENRINQKILQIKRAMPKARPQIEVSAQIGRLQNQQEILYHEFKNIRSQINGKYDELKKIRAQIAKIMQQKNEQKVTQVQVRSPQEIKTDYEARIQKVKQQREQVKSKLEKHKDNYFKSLDQYEDYNDLMQYIKMINEQKDKLKQRQAEQERRKKEKQQYEKKKQKQYQDRQKKRQQRKQKQEERKKYEQQKRERLKKQKEQYINQNPHHEKIQTCQSLIEYCELLKPQNAQKARIKAQERPVYAPIQKLPENNKDWQHEKKKGVQVIISKKMKADQQIPKKGKKQKKKKQKQESDTISGFTHQADIIRRFQSVNLLPPFIPTQIDDIIKQLRDKIQIFQKPTEQQINAFKIKAQKQFDAMHGLRNGEKSGKGYRVKQQETQGAPEEVQKKQKPKNKKYEKVQINGNEFPELN